MNNKSVLFTTNSTRGNYLIEVTGYHQDPQVGGIGAANTMKIIIEY